MILGQDCSPDFRKQPENLEKALLIAENVGDFALAGYAELGLGKQQQACKRPKEMQDSGMLKTEVSTWQQQVEYLQGAAN